MALIVRKIGWPQLLWALFYFLLFGFLLRNSFNYLDPDLGWHLRVGEEIARTQAIPDINSYNYTFTGHWVDHEWLSNFLLAWGYSHWGYIGVSVIFALLIIAVLAALNIAVRRLIPAVSPVVIIFFQGIGLIASLPHLGVRLQELAWVFLLVLLAIIRNYNRQRDWRHLLILPPFFYLWACLHGSFLIGWLVVGLWLGIKSLEKILKHYLAPGWLDLSAELSWREILIFGGAILLSFFATLLTPYKLSLYSFLGGYGDNFYLSHIQEWLSQFSFPFQYYQLLYLALVVLALLFYSYYTFSRERYFRLDLWTSALTLVFIVLAFKSRRHFPLMFVATFIFVIQVYGTIFRPFKRRWFSDNNFWLKGYLILVIFLVGVAQLAAVNYTSDPFRSFCRRYPCGAAAFLRQHPAYDSLNIFNDYGWGGFLIKTLPERKLFIDGRLPQVEFAGHTYLEEYLDFFKAGAASKKLDQYGIGLILIPAQDEPVRVRTWERILFSLREDELNLPNHLREYLRTAANWRIAWQDQTSVVYVKD